MFNGRAVVTRRLLSHGRPLRRNAINGRRQLARRHIALRVQRMSAGREPTMWLVKSTRHARTARSK